MKIIKLLIAGAALLALTCIFAPAAKAEVNLNINLGLPIISAQIPWAPAHGAPSYRYNYYPTFGVYFDPGRGLYFYLEANVWRSSRARPWYLVYPDRNYVVLDMDSPEPHRHHNEVVNHYPPGQWKKHDGDRRDNRDRGRGNDHRGKNKGRDRD
jgi:hypothetical protein